jgi:precorrin-6Y C5,15-methyltransferase (decarboxylating)
LSIIGIGEDGVDGLSAAAKRLLVDAELVVGGRRHLSLVGPIQGETLVWPSPITDAFPAILARRGRPVAILASGDPFFYGVGSTLTSQVAAGEMICVPAPSAFSLAAAQLYWAEQNCALVSLHGRALERVIPLLQPGARILALSWDQNTPRKLATLLTARGMGSSRLFICEAMGGPRQRVRQARAAEFAFDDIDPLNTIGIEIVANANAVVLPLTAGLPDGLFEHDGLLTKREIRALTLAALAPLQGELLWDIGAGCGSIAIEWMLRHPSNRAIAIEERPDRLQRIARNAAALGVPGLEIAEGHAPAALAGLPNPDAIFVGGGATDHGVIDAALDALARGGRLVINAVTIETQSELLQRHGRHGGELTTVQIAHADAIGGFRGWRPARPITRWVMVKS